MPAIGQDLVVWKDSHYTLTFRFDDLSELHNVSIKWVMFEGYYPHITKTNEDEAEIYKSENYFYVNIVPDDTFILGPGNYYYEARITESDGKTRPVACGELELRNALTERFYTFHPFWADTERWVGIE